MIYWNGGVYPYYYAGPLFTGFVDPWLFGPDVYVYVNSYGGGYTAYGGDVPAPYRDYGMQPSNDEQVAQGQSPAPRAEYAPQSAAYAGAAAREDAVTVIFKDGRQPEQIHNYLLTSTTLTVLDARYRQIPLDDVNVAATEAANRAAGVDFRVPATMK